jgi:hypothetical protein
MVERKKRSAEYWKEVVEDFLKSGKSQKEYVQEKKMSRVTLLAWSKRLNIPLSQRKKSLKVDRELPLTFTDVQVLGRIKAPSPSLKIEVIFPQGHILKLETERTWEEAGTFIKALMG